MVSVVFLILVPTSGILSLMILGTAQLFHHAKQTLKPTFSHSIFLKTIMNYFPCACVCVHVCASMCVRHILE